MNYWVATVAQVSYQFAGPFRRDREWAKEKVETWDQWCTHNFTGEYKFVVQERFDPENQERMLREVFLLMNSEEDMVLYRLRFRCPFGPPRKKVTTAK